MAMAGHRAAVAGIVLLVIASAPGTARGLANEYCSSWFSLTTGGSVSTACPPCRGKNIDACQPIDSYWMREEVCLLPVGYGGSIQTCGAPLVTQLKTPEGAVAGRVTIFQTVEWLLFVTYQVFCPWVMRGSLPVKAPAPYTSSLRVWNDTRYDSMAGMNTQYTDTFAEEGLYTCFTVQVDLTATCNPHTSRFTFRSGAAANKGCSCLSSSGTCPYANLVQENTLFITPSAYAFPVDEACNDSGLGPVTQAGVVLTAEVPGGGGTLPWAPQQCSFPPPPPVPNNPPPAPPGYPSPLRNSSPTELKPTEAGQVAPTPFVQPSDGPNSPPSPGRAGIPESSPHGTSPAPVRPWTQPEPSSSQPAPAPAVAPPLTPDSSGSNSRPSPSSVLPSIAGNSSTAGDDTSPAGSGDDGSSSSPQLAIVGAVVGGCVLLLLVAGGVMLVMYRRSQALLASITDGDDRDGTSKHTRNGATSGHAVSLEMMADGSSSNGSGIAAPTNTGRTTKQGGGGGGGGGYRGSGGGQRAPGMALHAGTHGRSAAPRGGSPQARSAGIEMRPRMRLPAGSGNGSRTTRSSSQYEISSDSMETVGAGEARGHSQLMAREQQEEEEDQGGYSAGCMTTDQYLRTAQWRLQHGRRQEVHGFRPAEYSDQESGGPQGRVSFLSSAEDMLAPSSSAPSGHNFTLPYPQQLQYSSSTGAHGNMAAGNFRQYMEQQQLSYVQAMRQMLSREQHGQQYGQQGMGPGHGAGLHLHGQGQRDGSARMAIHDAHDAELQALHDIQPQPSERMAACYDAWGAAAHAALADDQGSQGHRTIHHSTITARAQASGHRHQVPQPSHTHGHANANDHRSPYHSSFHPGRATVSAEGAQGSAAPQPSGTDAQHGVENVSAKVVEHATESASTPFQALAVQTAALAAPPAAQNKSASPIPPPVPTDAVLPGAPGSPQLSPAVLSSDSAQLPVAQSSIGSNALVGSGSSGSAGVRASPGSGMIGLLPNSSGGSISLVGEASLRSFSKSIGLYSNPSLNPLGLLPSGSSSSVPALNGSIGLLQPTVSSSVTVQLQLRSPKSMEGHVDMMLALQPGQVLWNRFQVTAPPPALHSPSRTVVPALDLQTQLPVLVKFPHNTASLQRQQQLLEAVPAGHMAQLIMSVEAVGGLPAALVMEAGTCCLSDLLHSRPQLAMQHLLLQQLFEALSSLHSLGWSHCDVDPSHVWWYQEAGRFKLTGASHCRQQGHDIPVQTKSGGVRMHHAPEIMQAGNQEAQAEVVATAASDCWSAGLIAHEVLTGQRLFADSATAADIAQQCAGDQPLAFEREDGPLNQAELPQASALLRGLLQRDPARRFTAAQALALLSPGPQAARADSDLIAPR